MEFQVGAKIIYPNHGLGTVEQITTQSVGGRRIEFYKLHMQESNSTVLVPIDNVSSVGLRATIPPEAVDALMGRLREVDIDSLPDWKERFRINTERMKTGHLLDVADVLKVLARVNARKTLSFREKKMFDRAKRLLVMEIASVTGVSDAAAEDAIDAALLRGVGPGALAIPSDEEED